MNIYSRAAGTLTGILTGAVSGVIPGYYRLLRKIRHKKDWAQLFGFIGVVIAWGVTLLPSMLWHAFKGMITGAMGGFMAGLTYPKSLNDTYQVEKERKKLVRKYLAVKDIFYDANPPSKGFVTEVQREESEAEKKKNKFIYGAVNHYYSKDLTPRLLTAEQLVALKTLQQVNFQDQIDAYETHASQPCPLSGKKLFEMDKPIVVVYKNADGKTSEVICDADSLDELMQGHIEHYNGLSILSSKDNLPAATILISGMSHEIVEFKPYAYPENISEFVKSALDALVSFERESSAFVLKMMRAQQRAGQAARFSATSLVVLDEESDAAPPKSTIVVEEVDVDADAHTPLLKAGPGRR